MNDRLPFLGGRLPYVPWVPHDFYLFPFFFHTIDTLPFNNVPRFRYLRFA